MSVFSNYPAVWGRKCGGERGGKSNFIRGKMCENRRDKKKNTCLHESCLLFFFFQSRASCPGFCSRREGALPPGWDVRETELLACFCFAC